MKKIIIKNITKAKNLITKKIIELDNQKVENASNHFLPVKRMKLIKTYFPGISKI